MISKLTGSLILLTGILLGVHSSMGMLQFKHFVSIHTEASGASGAQSDNTFSKVPMDIIAECLVGLLLILLSVAQLNGNFKEIVNPPQSNVRLFDQLFYSEDFATLQQRKHPLIAVDKE
ncbi:hypothetical protein RFI_32204 [Reticulomyxa filosa]|uniref:Uncharacterized protein n=1 Tax=Reticulomyxa filosa TaxID=46433 RepID=X6LU72_RETFI|nr:hypothetical protein RFI_32204 [Reticulomyxa filosa]|eukprot:ETO05194.1 hypothetical protein RFI_32204 [Reticulomyxa filosa]